MNSHLARQRGVTTLVAVAVLFFVVAMLAAYANRNLIIEQRVAYNYSQLGRAAEGAEQAQARMLSWLNSDHLNERCEADAAGPNTLRERLLRLDANGRIDVPEAAKATPAHESPWTVICDRLPAEGWRCQCPGNLQPQANLTAVAGQESVLLRMRPLPDGVGRISVSAAACTQSSGACMRETDDDGGERISRLHMLALLSALKMPPQIPLVVRGDLDLGSGMAVVNANPDTAGLSLHAGGTVRGQSARVVGPAGSPASSSMLDADAELAALPNSEFFRQFFGISPTDYQRQPALRQLNCEGEACTAALRTMVGAGAQLVAHAGDVTLRDAGSLGSAARPLVLLVGGALTVEGEFDFHGLVFVTGGMQWRNSSPRPARIQGALLVGGSLAGEQNTAVIYDAARLQNLQQRAGSFMALPGSQWSKSW